jgi:hypothetical protein
MYSFGYGRSSLPLNPLTVARTYTRVEFSTDAHRHSMSADCAFGIDFIHDKNHCILAQHMLTEGKRLSRLALTHKHLSSCAPCHRPTPSTLRFPLDDRPSSNGWLFFCPTHLSCPLSLPASDRETGLLLRYPMIVHGLRPCPGELLVYHPRHSISPILSECPIIFPTQPAHGISVALHAAKRRVLPPTREHPATPTTRNWSINVQNRHRPLREK